MGMPSSHKEPIVVPIGILEDLEDAPACCVGLYWLGLAGWLAGGMLRLSLASGTLDVGDNSADRARKLCGPSGDMRVPLGCGAIP